MSIISAFAGNYSALDYWYGGPQPYCPPPIEILEGNTATGAGTITVSANFTLTQGSSAFKPFVVGQSIQVGLGTAQETVTITSVGASSLVGPNPSAYSITIGATFTQLHGYGDPVSSVTLGLQEAINVANGVGGGQVTVTPLWYANGGSSAIIQAASLPSNFSVSIQDVSGDGTIWVNGPTATTVLAVPATATSAVVASQTGTGTWPASTTHVVFAYVTATGGITLTSADYSFTATLNKAIGGSGPAAATGAVGYLVFMGTTAWKVPVIAANGTVITCGSISCFQIGTPFSVATATTSALAVIPNQSTAFSGVKPVPFEDSSAAQEFQSISGPYAVTGVITAAGAVKELAGQNFPAGYFNYVNRAVEIDIMGYFTPVSTAQLTFAVNLVSVLGVTSTTVITLTPAASSGTSASNFYLKLWISTATTGATGTVECHGYVVWGLATATPGLATVFDDNIQVVSSAIDLTAQLYLQATLAATTANITTSQCRLMIIKPIS